MRILFFTATVFLIAWPGFGQDYHIYWTNATTNSYDLTSFPGPNLHLWPNNPPGIDRVRR